METRRKRSLKGANSEQMSNVLIKQEVVWLAEDSHAPDAANQEVGVSMESTRFIYTEEDSYHTDEASHTEQESTPVPQTYEYIKAELIKDEEFRDMMSDPEESCNQLVQPLADDQQAKASTSDKEMCGSSFAQKTNLEVHMSTKHLDKAQSSTPFECSPAFNLKANLKRHLRLHDKHEKLEYPCDLCERTFFSIANLNRHKDDHTRQLSAERKPFICEFCDFAFTEKGSLKRHMLNKHLYKPHSITLFEKKDYRKPFRCDVCERSYSSIAYLKRHKDIHTRELCAEYKTFICEVCKFRFTVKSSLKRHILKMHPHKMQLNTPGPQTADEDATCEVCGSTFNRKGQLRLHMLIKHSNKSQPMTSPPLTADHNSINTIQISENTARLSEIESDVKSEACRVCHCIYPTEYIRVHMRLAHPKPKFECKFCPRLFNRRCDLEAHVNTHAAVRKPDFACDLCGKKFYNERSLWCHKKVQTQDTFDCKASGERFQPKESFDETPQFTPQPSNDDDVPMKTELTSDEEEEFIDEGNDGDAVSHAEGSQPAVDADDEQSVVFGHAEDSVSCEFCHNSFPGELIETHMSTTHGDAIYKCQSCPRIFLSKSELESHITSHADKGKHTRRYACELCGKFLFKESLKQHMTTHHTKYRIPQFKCKLCEENFYTKPGLKDHAWTHAGLTFNCELCEARFTRVQSLKYHMLRQHTSKTQQCKLDPTTENDDSVQTKEELISDEEFLDEGT